MSLRFFVPLGPGFWLSRIIALQNGRVRRFRGGRVDILNVRPPAEWDAYRRAHGPLLVVRAAGLGKFPPTGPEFVRGYAFADGSRGASGHVNKQKAEVS